MLNLTSIDPIKALFWSAVINGVIAVPIMAIMMAMAAKSEIMGKIGSYVSSPDTRLACDSGDGVCGAYDGNNAAEMKSLFTSELL